MKINMGRIPTYYQDCGTYSRMRRLSIFLCKCGVILISAKICFRSQLSKKARNAVQISKALQMVTAVEQLKPNSQWTPTELTPAIWHGKT
jgi:hypothetical protein